MREFNITKYRVPALAVSGLVIVSFWIYTLYLSGGFNFGIDFQAGVNYTVDISSSSDEEMIREELSDFKPQVQTVGNEGRRYNIRVPDDGSTADFQSTTSTRITKLLNDRFNGVSFISEEYIGSSFASSLATQTIWVTLIALGLILLYVWIRFKLNYAVSAIAAVFHDVLFLLGFIGALQLEFSTATIAAVLTIIGYSLNDTIVIFDRIRENSRIVKDMSFRRIINLSVSQSLSRTLITSITTLLAVLAIYIFATGTIRTFAVSLVVGVIVGTYSSIFVASPILLAWHDRGVKRMKATLADPNPAVSSVPAGSPAKPGRPISEPVKRQTAEEIAEATDKRARAKARKKKKKNKH